jgi:hypothetical protein
MNQNMTFSNVALLDYEQSVSVNSFCLLLGRKIGETPVEIGPVDRAMVS